MRISISVEPAGQMRARHRAMKLKNGTILSKTYKHATQAGREESLAALLAPYQPQEPFEGPLLLKVRAVMSIPESWSKRKQAQAAAGEIRPTKKPDLDNILKNVKDVLTQMRFWKDDSQVVEYIPGTGKWYGMTPRVEIEILPASPPGTGA